MTGLHRTPLTTSRKIECAARALAGQDEHGAKTALSEAYGISRPTVYAAGATAAEVLKEHFETSAACGATVKVGVDEAQLRRAVVALRVVSPNAIRSIEDLLPILYPGVRVSYGKIQQWLVEAQGRAAAFNQRAALSGIEAGALDEMFSQGEPVLAGVDLDSGYLFGLRLSETRDAKAWAEMLREGQSQGLGLSVVVKDAARGIEAGVRAVYPEAEQRDDCFHALYEMNKVRRRLEQRAYGAITEELEAEAKLRRVRAKEREQRVHLQRKLVWARQRCRAAIARFDTVEAAKCQAQEAMEYIDLDSGRLRRAQAVQTLIEQAARTLADIDEPHCRKVAKYLTNRAPGLALAIAALRPRLEQAGAGYPDEALPLACLIWRLVGDLKQGRRRGARRESRRHLLGAYARLTALLGADRAGVLLDTVQAVLEHHHRASSAIEGFNAALRPYLYVHKGVTQGFLNLFRAHYNLRTRRWGRHKGTTAHQCLTGEHVPDWLAVLGYPPSHTVH
ncbi:MAG: transposase [Anaerolineales bacterium]